MPFPLRLARVFLLFGFALVASWWIAPDLEADDALRVLHRNAIIVELWLAVLALAGVLLLGRRPVDLLGLGRSRFSAGTLALSMLGTLAAGHALDAARVLSGFDEGPVMRELAAILAGAPPARLAEALFALALAPALAEELFCRGLVQRGLATRFGAPLAIGVAAGVFALLHLEPVQAAYAGVLGVYLGLLASWADSTRPAIWCHATNNTLAVLFLARRGEAPWGPEVSVVVGGALALGCLVLVARRRPIAASADPPGNPG